MSRIEGLLQAYEELVRQPWAESLAGAEKVWFAVYEPSQERRLQFRMQEFETVTKKAGHGWHHLDIAPLFAAWMGAHKYREAYFQDPELMDLALQAFHEHVSEYVRKALPAPGESEDCVTAISGAGALFGLASVSEVIEQVTANISGRLLVFFPGSYENAHYRLLDAHVGWNYLAIPIIARKEEGEP